MRGVLRNRLVAVLAVVAILLATSSYLTHARDGFATQHDDVRCTLCLQFGGTAGSPVVGNVVSVPALVVRIGPSKPQSLITFGRKAGICLPRAPPATRLI